MPCTMEPWEVEYEEKQLNKKKYGIKVTDAEMLTRVACEFAHYIEKACGTVTTTAFSKEAVDWWTRHRKWDKSQGR